MKKFIGVIVALILGAAWMSLAVANTGDKGFYYEARNQQHLAELNEAALKKDSLGGTRLDVAKCKADGSCATPLDYFEGINAAFEKAGVKKRLKSVSEVPAYLMTLKVVPSPHGMYEVSCLRPLGNDKFRRVMDCLQRAFEPGEEAWVDTIEEDGTKVELTMITSKCANVVYRKLTLKIEVIDNKCNATYTLTANAWSLQTFPPELRAKAEELIAAANASDALGGKSIAAYQGDRFSRLIGKPAREQVKTRAPIQADIKVRYVSVNPSIREAVVDKDGRVLGREVGMLKMTNGIGKFTFPDDPRGQVIELIWPTEFLSPTMSGGAPTMRIVGEWPNDVCDVQANGAVK